MRNHTTAGSPLSPEEYIVSSYILICFAVQYVSELIQEDDVEKKRISDEVLDRVQKYVDGLCVAFLTDTLKKGHSIKIPSLGIVISPDDDRENK